MVRSDRTLVEDLFSDKHVQVCITIIDTIIHHIHTNNAYYSMT
jgi:hypothetical protein